MSQISNRFYVTALEDGTTLHGNLASDNSLVQAWNGTTAIPNWKGSGTEGTQQSPTIWLTLLSGATTVAPDSNFKWYYNDNEIIFGNDNVSTSPSGVFRKTTHNVPTGIGTETIAMPAIKIVDNLAASSNVDVDTITFKGRYVLNGSGIDFACTAQVKISAITASGYVGVINFVNGISDITEAGQVLTMYGTLYSGETGAAVTGITTKWFLNNESGQGTSGSSITVDGTTYANAYQVTEDDVVDHATVRCEFYQSANLLAAAYVGIDDMQDPEFMYIQYNGNNGNAASLRKDETATFQIWVGTRDDPSVIGGASTPTYSIIKVKLIDGEGIPIGGKDDTTVPKRSGTLATGIPSCEGGDSGDGWRDLTSLMSGGKATIAVHYTTVNDYGKRNLTGIVMASVAVNP